MRSLRSLFWLYRWNISSDLALQVCPVNCMTADVASLDAVYHWNGVWTLRVTLSPWLRLTVDIYPTGLSSVWWRYIIYVWCGRHSLRDGTYISRALLLQLGLMGLWSNKYCHRVPRDNLQMVLALSFSHFLSFFHSSSPSRLCLASWPWSMVSSAIFSFVRGQIEDRWTGSV